MPDPDPRGGPEPGPRPAPGVWIPVRSERQAMEWSLALASQDIACVIRKPAEELGWALEVDPDEAGRALRTLRLYVGENRRWRAAFEPTMAGFVFHWGVLLWCFLQVVVFWAANGVEGRLEARGVFDTARTADGDWWRPLTATFLHAGPDHLAANLTTGFVLLGLAMGRFGAGPALLVSLLAGVAGNLLAWAGRGHDYTGLGASGVVMGALGMLAVSLFIDARAHRVSPAAVLRGVLGGILLFILLGTAPRSDVLAHAGGFLAGIVLTLPLAWLPRQAQEWTKVDVAAAAVYLAATGTAWIFALR